MDSAACVFAGLATNPYPGIPVVVPPKVKNRSRCRQLTFSKTFTLCTLSRLQEPPKPHICRAPETCCRTFRIGAPNLSLHLSSLSVCPFSQSRNFLVFAASHASTRNVVGSCTSVRAWSVHTLCAAHCRLRDREDGMGTLCCRAGSGLGGMESA
jgi:hypothetical protein